MEQILKSYLEYICGASNVQENVPLSTKTTFRIGGPARFFVNVQAKENLMRLISTLEYIEHPYFIIGAGANILASDKGFDGVVIKLGFDEIMDNQCFIYADAGAPLRKVATYAREHGLGGLEWSAGIPATVGGAVHSNAGAFDGEMSKVIAMVDTLIDGEIKTLDAKQLKFAHRTSIFKKRKNWIIIGAYFFLSQKPKEEIAKLETIFLEKRKLTQPKEPSAGSIFKRPNPDFIPSKAIDELGLKGTAVGSAKISEKHAGFIVNTGEAKSDDVKSLIKLIKKEIYAKHGIRLHEEIKFLP